ncbi:unnamed protein product [Schistosoma turkestanicum]|nr:unnamed protein product [Schistosoma turkestanicum]
MVVTHLESCHRIKSDLFNTSLSTYPSDKPNKIDTKITTTTTTTTTTTAILEKEPIISHIHSNDSSKDNLKSYNSSLLQDKKCTMKQDTLIPSQPINIKLHEESNGCKVKQPLDHMYTSTGEQNSNKSNFVSNSRPHICMSPRCPPDGAAIHEISPPSLSKSKKSVIYENLIDRYLLMEDEKHLMKEISSKSSITTNNIKTTTTTTTSTTTTTTITTTSTSTNNRSSVLNNHIHDNSTNSNNNTNPKDLTTHNVSTQSTQTTFDMIALTSTNLPIQDCFPTCDSINKNYLTSESTISYTSPSNETVNTPIEPHSSTNTNTWFPPPPPQLLQDSMVNSTNFVAQPPHYHEHCRPDDVHPLVINKMPEKSSDIINDLNVSSPDQINSSTKTCTSISPTTNLKLSTSSPTSHLPPVSSSSHPPSVPPRHPATALQYQPEVADSLKTTHEKTKNNIVSEKLEDKSHQKFTDTCNTVSVSTPLITSSSSSCENSVSANIPQTHNSMNQSDKLTDSSVMLTTDKIKISTNNSLELTESSKIQTVSPGILDERNKNPTNYPLDGRSVVPWDSNLQDNFLLSVTSSMKTLQTNETEMIKSTCTVSCDSTVTSSTSFSDKRNVNWAFSQQHASSYPSEKLVTPCVDSINPVLVKKQSVKFHDSNRLQNDQKSTVTVTRPNFLPDFVLIKSTQPGQPSIKRLISPDDLKNERIIGKHYNVANNYNLNQSSLLQNQEQNEFVQFVYPVKDSAHISHHNRELLINSHPEIQSNQPIDVYWLKAQQRAELMNSNNVRNGIHRSFRDFPQRQISAEPAFTNIQPSVMQLSPTRTHKEHFTSKIASADNSSKNSNILLMTQSSLPAGFPEQQSEFFPHYRHKSDNLVHTNPNFITEIKSNRMSSDSIHEQRYSHRNRSYNAEDSYMRELIAPNYNNSMTQSVFFPLDSGWAPPDVKSNDSTSGKHKKHNSNMIRSHSQRTNDSQANFESNQLGASSDHTRCLIPSKHYHRNLSQTVPANPDSNSNWPPVLVQWHRRRPNVAASTENFPDLVDYQRNKRYNENMHIPAEYYIHHKSDFSRHHNSTSAISEQLENQPWFHHDLSRSHAEKLLKSTPTGSFLVRRSETSKTELSLSIKRESDVLHMKISQDPETRGYVLGEYSQPYPSVSAMIYRYSRTLLPVRGTTPVLLRFPISRVAFSH